MNGVPFSVTLPGEPETATLVLGVSYPFLLVGPGPGETALRWVDARECGIGRLYFDRPWSDDFVRPASPAEHEHGGAP